MWNHTEKLHAGSIGPDKGRNDYLMIKLKSFKESLKRQCEEGVRIAKLEEKEKEGKVICANSKIEFIQPAITTITTYSGSSKED